MATWNATALEPVELAAHEGETAAKTARRRAATAAVRCIAGYLANTPSVCRNSYIDPHGSPTASTTGEPGRPALGG